MKTQIKKTIIDIIFEYRLGHFAHEYPVDLKYPTSQVSHKIPE